MTLPDRILAKRSINPTEILLNVASHIAQAETSADAFEDAIFAVDLCLFLLKPRTQRDISRTFRTAELRRSFERTLVTDAFRERYYLREEERESDGV